MYWQILLVAFMLKRIGTIIHELGHAITAFAVGLRVIEVKLWRYPPHLSFEIKGTRVRISPWLWGGSYVLLEPSRNAWKNIWITVSGSLWELVFALLLGAGFFGAVTSQLASAFVSESWTFTDILLLLMKLELYPPTLFDLTQPEVNELIREAGSWSLLEIAEVLDKGGFWFKSVLAGWLWIVSSAVSSLLPLPGRDGGSIVRMSLTALGVRLPLPRNWQEAIERYFKEREERRRFAAESWQQLKEDLREEIGERLEEVRRRVLRIKEDSDEHD